MIQTDKQTNNLQARHARDKSEWSENPERTKGLRVEAFQLGGLNFFLDKILSTSRLFQLGIAQLWLDSQIITCIVDKKMSMKPIITMVKSRKFHVFWNVKYVYLVTPLFHALSLSQQKKICHLQISFFMLPQPLGNDCRKALNSEYHHKNYLKKIKIKIIMKITWNLQNFNLVLEKESFTSISSSNLFVSSLSLFG